MLSLVASLSPAAVNGSRSSHGVCTCIYIYIYIYRERSIYVYVYARMHIEHTW